MNKYNYNLDTLNKLDNISYYLLGSFITDGCIYIRKDRSNTKITTLTSKDKNWLELINNIICPEKPILNHGKNCYRLMYCSTEISNWFIDHGCLPNKSLSTYIPNIPNPYIKDFIRGCWDGDGSISFTKTKTDGYQRQANITSGSKLFCENMSKILTEMEIKNKVYTHTLQTDKRQIEDRVIKGASYRCILSNGEAVYKLCKFYENNFAMPRKKDIALKIINDWEKPILCVMCHSILNVNKKQRRKKYCDTCLKLHQNKIKRIQYHLNKIQH